MHPNMLNKFCAGMCREKVLDEKGMDGTYVHALGLQYMQDMQNMQSNM